MSRLKAWGQVSGAPAHLQLVQGPTLNRLSQSGEACVANFVAVQILCMAHQTKRLSQKGVYANSQGMGTRQWGASTSSSGPGPRSPP